MLAKWKKYPFLKYIPVLAYLSREDTVLSDSTTIAKGPSLVLPRVHILLVAVFLGIMGSLLWTLEGSWANEYIESRLYRNALLDARHTTAVAAAYAGAFAGFWIAVRWVIVRFLPAVGERLSLTRLTVLLKNANSRAVLYVLFFSLSFAAYSLSGIELRFGATVYFRLPVFLTLLVAVIGWRSPSYGGSSPARFHAFVGGLFFAGLVYAVDNNLALSYKPATGAFEAAWLIQKGLLLALVLMTFFLARGHVLLTAEHLNRNNSRPMVVSTSLISAALVLFLAAWVALPLYVAKPKAVSNPKNILVIAVDTLRADRLSLDGEGPLGRDTTPNLRRLANLGTVFENAISQAPWTQPAFGSLLTGLYPHEHGALAFPDHLPRKNITLAERLRERGYTTGAAISQTHVDRKRGFSQGYDWFDQSNSKGSHKDITGHGVTDKGLGFLRRHKSDSFFLFLHYFDPHSEYRDHKDWDYADGYTGWLSREFMHATNLNLQRSRLLEEDVSHIVDLYDEEVAYTDREIGRVLDYLEEEEMLEDTAIIFVSDHGEEFMEHDWIGHVITLYDEVIRVPFICYFPGIENAPKVISDTVETRGMFALVLEYLGIPHATDDWDSGLLARLRGEEGAPSAAYSSLWLPHEPIASGMRARMASLRTNKWKYITDVTRKLDLLFNLELDPMELENVVDDETDVSRELKQSLSEWLDAMTSARPKTPRRRLDESTEEELKSLGYL